MAKTKTKEPGATLFAETETKPVATTAAKPKTESRVVAIKKHDEPPNLLVAIVQAAADPKCQPDKMHALLDARDRLMKAEAHVAFVTAYIEMQSELPTIDAKGRIEIEAKRQGGKKQDTRYATYQEIQRVTKPILRKHGFAMLMLPDVGQNGVGVTMRGQLAYVCNTQYGKMVHVESCLIAAPLETGGSKNNVQGVGSSLSYTKRYCSVALLDLVSHAPEDKDDDARATSKTTAEPEEATTITPKQVTELKRAIEDCGVGEDTFCNKYKIESGNIEDLPPAMLAEALRSCRNFKAERDRRNANAKAD